MYMNLMVVEQVLYNKDWGMKAVLKLLVGNYAFEVWHLVLFLKGFEETINFGFIRLVSSQCYCIWQYYLVYSTRSTGGLLGQMQLITFHLL